MRKTTVLALLVATQVLGLAFGQTTGQMRRQASNPTSNPIDLAGPIEPAGCTISLSAPELCLDGAIGDGTPQQFSALTQAEITAIVNAAASALNVSTATIAVVDRTGRPLAVFRQPG